MISEVHFKVVDEFINDFP